MDNDQDCDAGGRPNGVPAELAAFVNAVLQEQGVWIGENMHRVADGNPMFPLVRASFFRVPLKTDCHNRIIPPDL